MLFDTSFGPVRKGLSKVSEKKLSPQEARLTLAISLHVFEASRICLRRCSSPAVQGVFVRLLFLVVSSAFTRFPIDKGPAELLSLGDKTGGGLGSSCTPGDAALLRELELGGKGGGAVLSGRGSSGIWVGS